MVVVLRYCESTFEQWIHTVSAYIYARPSGTYPAIIQLLHPCLAFENLVLVPRNLFGSEWMTLCIHIRNRSSLGQNVMIGLEGEFDALLLLVKLEV